jgi:hypothetical protein
MFKKKITEDVPAKRKTVADLVDSFTGQFQEVADQNANIADAQESIINSATIIRDSATEEKRKAEKFVDNFAKLCE